MVHTLLCKEKYAKETSFALRTVSSSFPYKVLLEGFAPSKLNSNYSQCLFETLFLIHLGQALGLLVSVRSIHYCTSTPDLSTT